MLSVSFFQADHSNESRDGKESLSCQREKSGRAIYTPFLDEVSC
jgi:hypothetical protein